MDHQALRRDGFVRVVGAFAVMLTVALTSACNGCGDEPIESASDAPAEARPDSPREVSLALAERVDGTTPFFVAVRDPRGLMAAYADIRPHLEAVLGGDLGMVETDLRNTLGLDLARPETLEAAGIAADGGVGISWVGEHIFYAVVISDARRFEEKIVALLQARPFSLTAEVERRRVGGAQTLTFRRTDGGDPDIVVAVHPPFAFFLPNATDPAIDEVITSLTTDRPSPLAERPEFIASVDRAEHYQVQVYASAPVLADARPEDVTAALEGITPPDVDPAETLAGFRNLGELTLGLRLSEAGLESRLTQTPSPEVAADLAAITQGDGDPGLATLAVPDVYAFVRLTLAPERMLEAVERILGEERAAELRTNMETQSERVGVSLRDALVPALGQNTMVLLTRARLLTLSRAMSNSSPGEFFSGLGVVVAFEVEDAATVRSALQGIAPAMGERANVFEDGDTLVVEFTDADADIGNLVLTDRFLLLVPARQRSEVIDQLGGVGADLSWIDVAAARNLVTAASANGMFIDVARVVDGPIGQVAFARLPAEARRLLGRIGRLYATAGVEDGVVTTDVAIRFLDIEATGD